MNILTFFRISGLILALTVFQTVSAINADIIVAKDGSGNFTKIQDAINAVPSNQLNRRTVIFIKNGLYNTEKLIIPADKINVTLLGESRDQTIISYHIYDCTSPESGNKCPAADANLWTGDVIRTSATLTIAGEGFRAENLTIRNTAGPVGQALAITVTADKTAFINCNLLGYQDTIYLWTAGKRTWFQNCLVLGRTDYIYGGGIGYFEGCEIRSHGGGWITAPSTPQTQAYGFVFNHCNITYADGSPRNGDDGAKFRLGRPWQNYPKVSWLNCNITGMLNPQGWGDTWNMTWATTSTDLHLYEYNNTGAGADMSQRAAWAGLRAITAQEAANYTPEKVLNGTDGWAPWQEVALAKTYQWDNGGNDSLWLNNTNWNPDGSPQTAEAAYVTGNKTIKANGGQFNADLFLQNGATILVTANSTLTYLSVEKSTLAAHSDVILSGKIATKDSMHLLSTATLTIQASLQGVHRIIKKGIGKVVLAADNSGFSGPVEIAEGIIEANTASSLGKGNIEVKANATLKVGHSNAFNVKSALRIVNGSKLELLSDITLSELYINGQLQGLGTYDASTHATLISGTGKIQVGRPSVFKFAGGLWDVAGNYAPALLPLEGETVLCEGEMETAATANKANITFVDGKGKLRLRGTHSSTGILTFEGNQRISYATSGAGFTLTAPIVLQGNISIEMSSANAAGNSMILNGTMAGQTVVAVKNTRNTATEAKLVLGGNNENFSGTWDVTTAGIIAGATAAIAGTSTKAFGKGTIKAGAGNKVYFDHSQSTSTANKLMLTSGAKAILNADITLGALTLDSETLKAGTYGANTHPAWFSGTGTITLTPTSVNNPVWSDFSAYYNQGKLRISGTYERISIYNIAGQLIHDIKNNDAEVDFKAVKGVYLVSNGLGKLIKISVTNQAL